jgi:hypothetical protein
VTVPFSKEGVLASLVEVKQGFTKVVLSQVHPASEQIQKAELPLSVVHSQTAMIIL